MNILKKWILRGFLGILFLGFVAGSWYCYKNFSRKAPVLEINTGHSGDRVLLASQGSEFKDQFVTSFCDSLQGHVSILKVVELKDLNEIVASDWDRIILLNSFIVKLNRRVGRFIDGLESPEKVLLLVTSGGADWKPQPDLELDAITSASQLANSEEILQLALDWMKHDLSSSWVPRDAILALLFYPRVDVERAISSIQSERGHYESRYSNLEGLIDLIGNFFLRLHEEEGARKIFKLKTDLYS